MYVLQTLQDRDWVKLAERQQTLHVAAVCSQISAVNSWDSSVLLLPLLSALTCTEEIRQRSFLSQRISDSRVVSMIHL